MSRELTMTEIMMRQQRYAMLSEHQHIQEETIANHYSSLAHMAMQLRMLIEERNFIRRNGHDSKNLDDAIEMMTKEIKKIHLADFGLELEWPERKTR
jgi:hypothetical protein